jgi:hypothetical protein
MHCCGNPWHDIPYNLALLLPALSGALLWLRVRGAWLHAKLARFLPKSKKCQCGQIHEVEEGERRYPRVRPGTLAPLLRYENRKPPTPTK